MINQCCTCCFYGECYSEDECEYHTPAGFGDIDGYIEQGRLEFYDDWFHYLYDNES